MAPKSTLRSFANIEGDFCRQPLTIKVLHTWEARNFRRRNAPMGLEMLLIDCSGQTMQGFVATNRIFCFKASLKSKVVYELNNFTLVPARTMYRVSPNKLCAIFTHQTALKEVDGVSYEFDGNAFRTRSYKELSLIADRKGDLFVGRQSRSTYGTRLLKCSGNSGICPTKPVVILVTAIHPKTFAGENLNSMHTLDLCSNSKMKGEHITSNMLAGVLTLSTTSSTCMFFDKDIPETEKHFARLGMDAQQDVTTIRFYCLATIEDVNRDAQWSSVDNQLHPVQNQVASLRNHIDMHQRAVYRFELSVWDTTGSATFVVLDDVGQQLAGQTAAELMDNLSVATTNAEGDTYTTIPQCLLDTIGTTYNF
ncbi:unnamed protein product [Cochlearia groenlandica]